MKIATLALGILLCSAAIAEPQPWMKKENPDTLHSSVFVSSECAFTEERVRKVVDGVLIRSRLKTGDYISGPEPFGFVVDVNCMDGTSNAFIINVHFIRFIPELFRNVLESTSYGNFGVGDAEYTLDGVKLSVEELVTDYLQANFDLAPE